MNPKPQTIADSLMDKIDALYDRGRLSDASDWDIRLISNEVKKLTTSHDLTQKSQGFALESAVALVTGNIELGIKRAQQALTASQHASDIAILVIQYYCKAGLYMEALSVSTKIFNLPQVDYLRWQLQICYVLLMPELMEGMVKMVKNLGQSIPDHLLAYETPLSDIFSGMRKWNITAEHAQSMIGLAARIAQENKYTLYKVPTIEVDHSAELIWYYIMIDAEPSEVLRLNDLFVDALFNEQDNAPVKNLHVNFARIH